VFWCTVSDLSAAVLCQRSPAVQTEFVDRSLVTSGNPLEVVRVKETTSTGCQTITVEGTLSDDFFKIREAVYSMYSAV
jgi:hypothetical protein